MVLAVLAAMVVCWAEPASSASTASQFIAKRIDVGQFEIPLATIQTSLLVLLTALCFRLFQLDVYVEKSYPYLHRLEDILEESVGEADAFTREGRRYKREFAWFAELTWVFYKWVLPLAIFCAGLGFGIVAMLGVPAWCLRFVLDGLAVLALFLSTACYLHDLHCKRERSAKPVK